MAHWAGSCSRCRGRASGGVFLSGGIFISRSIFLLNYAFSYLNLAQASIFTNLVTVVSIAAGIVFLGESFTALQGIGSIAILTGVYLSNHIKGRTE
ncbi:MAG: EamA family transporter [Eisenbergiella sp.]